MSKFETFKNSIVKFATKTKVAGVKYAPPALIAVGTAGLIWAGIEAYKSKDKVNATLDKYEEKELNGEVINRTDVAVDVVKDVAKPLLIAGTSVAAIATGTAIFNKRLRYVTLALATVTEEYERYRNNAQATLTEEDYLRLETQQIDHTDEETGEVTQKAVAVNNSDLFARWFQYSDKYEKGDPGYNEHLIRDARDWANNRIMTRGVLTFAELMDYLGFDCSAYQMQFGWHDTDGFYLDWSEHDIFDEETLGNTVEHLVKWKRPRPLYS